MKNQDPLIIGHLLLSKDKKVREVTLELLESVCRSCYTWIIGERGVGSATFEDEFIKCKIEFKDNHETK
jgi:hypothetical protein